ncbi:MAG: hypothetical protein Q9184_005107 [Pyrenodesmia sp. 2 TL-2023]
MRTAILDPHERSYDDLAKNGWQVHPSADTEGLAPAMLDAMRDLHIPLEDEDNLLINALLTEPFVNSREEKKNSLTPFPPNPQEPIRRPYWQHYNAHGGAIIARSNYGPTYRAQAAHSPKTEDDLNALLPPLHNWADVVRAIWSRTAGPLRRAKDLHYIFRYRVQNAETQGLMEIAADHSAQGAESMRLLWPVGEKIPTSFGSL